MKRTICLFVAAWMLIGCEKEPQTIAVESVSVSPGTLSLTEGESGNLTASVSPSNASDKTITWTTSDAAVAMVSDGRVTAVKAGTATITATAGAQKGACTVTVFAAVVAVTGISLDITEKELLEGETQQLTATVEPSDATDKTVTWSTSNNKVATVAGGLITAVAEGQATITASAGGKEATCAVTVLTTTPKIVDLGLSVKWADRNLGATRPTGYGNYYAWGETEPKTAYSWSTYKWYDNGYLTKYNTTDDTILQPEDDAAHVVLGDQWRMPMKAELQELIGECTWTWKDGQKAYEVKGPNGNTILVPLTGYIENNTLSEMMSSTCLSSTLYDPTTSYCFIITNEIPGTLGYASRQAGFSIRPVYGELPAPTGVSLNSKSVTRYPGGMAKLKADVLPEDAIYKAVKWSSSNEAVATVDGQGIVTVVGAGEAVITATTAVGGHTDQCTVTVLPMPDGAATSMSAFNASTVEDPILILQNSWGGEYTLTRENGTVDLNGHSIDVLYMRNNDPDKAVTLRNGAIKNRLDGGAVWGSGVYRGKVILEEMDVLGEFYTDGHVYTLNSGYYYTVTTYRYGDASGDVNIYGGTYEALWDVNPDAGSNQGVFTLYGGKFAFDPRDYKNPGYNRWAKTKINIAEGYSVQGNTGSDKEKYPYIVSKD